MLREAELRVLAAVRESVSVTDLADRLDRSQSFVSEVVTDLEKKGLVRKERAGRAKQVLPTDSKAVELYQDIAQRYRHVDLPVLLSGPTIQFLYYLDEPITVTELADRTDNYRNTVHRRVKQLLDRGILRKQETQYQLTDEFQILNRFAHEYVHHVHRQRASTAMDTFTILWEDHGSFLAQTDREVTDDSFLLTGPERFQDFDLPLLATEDRYYFYPTSQIGSSPEELVCHMLLIDSGSRYRSYCLLLIISQDLDESLLRSRSEYYGILDVIDGLLAYLASRGEDTTKALPSWDEFVALAEEYEVAV